MTTPHRILPPNCWLPADAEATGAECSRFCYTVWWAEDCEDPEMPSQRRAVPSAWCNLAGNNQSYWRPDLAGRAGEEWPHQRTSVGCQSPPTLLGARAST